jgi:2-polyprenyl-6-methoxyphenol hydroxylase-like FAD-dependent oxidoreductase
VTPEKELDMSVANAEVDVLIVGGGPVGLSARALLDRWGVSTLLVEKHRELSPFPRSRLVNVRSMEIFRQLGLAATIAARAFAPEFGRIRFRDTLLDHDFATAAMVGINAPVPESPVIGVLTSQDRLEPILIATADTPVRFGVELIDLTGEAESVVATLGDHEGGEETRVRARYVLAADGANSTVRQRLGIDTIGPGALVGLTTVVFDADLNRWSAQQPAGVYATAHGSFLPLYPEGGWAWIGPTPEDPARADWPDLVSRAIGPNAEIQADVLRVQHWVVNAFIAERFRHGRVLLAGDAAHAIPPSGGLGMNVGLADVHNLCWKLAGVLHGWAGPDLLETYDAERQPVAQRNLRQAVANSQLMHQAQSRRHEQLQAGETAPAQIELPWSDRYFAQLGLVLGVAYHSDAVLTNGSTPPELSDPGTVYIPTAEPGHRMPHLWLKDNHSTLDTHGEWFTVLTPDPTQWERQSAAPWPLHIEALPSEHTDLCGLGPHGALLIRPDGHISARWSGRPPSDSALHHALTTITGSTNVGESQASV